MLLLLDVCGLKCAANCILLFVVNSPNIGYVVLLCYYVIVLLCYML
jgi:hypothetical protein